MKGQAKVLIPAAIGIAILLLTGIPERLLGPGERQATFTDSVAVTHEAGRRAMLSAAFRSSADDAARQAAADIGADLTIDLRPTPNQVVAKADSH